MTSPTGVTEANCTAQSRPAAHVTWDTGGDNRTLGPPILSLYEQGDGTTIVTSTLLFQSGQLSEQSVKCVVRHQGLEKPLTLPLNSDGEYSENAAKSPSIGKVLEMQEDRCWFFLLLLSGVIVVSSERQTVVL